MWVKISLHVKECVLILKGEAFCQKHFGPPTSCQMYENFIQGRKQDERYKGAQRHYSNSFRQLLLFINLTVRQRQNAMPETQTKVTVRGGKRAEETCILENTGPHDMYLNPGSWDSEHFSCHQGTWEGHPVSGVNKAVSLTTELR